MNIEIKNKNCLIVYIIEILKKYYVQCTNMIIKPEFLRVFLDIPIYTRPIIIIDSTFSVYISNNLYVY